MIPGAQVASPTRLLSLLEPLCSVLTARATSLMKTCVRIHIYGAHDAYCGLTFSRNSAQTLCSSSGYSRRITTMSRWFTIRFVSMSCAINSLSMLTWSYSLAWYWNVYLRQPEARKYHQSGRPAPGPDVRLEPRRARHGYVSSVLCWILSRKPCFVRRL